ncbi:hypothetical protein Tsubulata_042101 [Turnera subulata]|uniref:MBD domain-containing protein n=1 Tax=Turnera subulata TaxID=218843 RepID=A0A9Q0GIV1_9ROSI|nr:hypothetical protein Tsubulata_042101 [Turnera subulata]
MNSFYFPPSGEGRFNSKIEVSRYLKDNPPKCEEEETDKCNSTNEVSQSLTDNPPESEEEEKGNDSLYSRKVVFEKAVAEGLPPGWTKEIKVTTRGHKIRKDPFYTDPVSGYIFRSLKDALRYVESGEVGRLAFKRKDKGNKHVELEDDKTPSPAVAEKQKLAVDGTSPVMSEQSSNLCESSMDEQIHNSSCKGGTKDFDQTYDHSELTEDKGADQAEAKSDSVRNATVGIAAAELMDKQPLESRAAKDENGSYAVRKRKKSKDLNLPRRSSKRLAGLPLDPTPELQTRKRTSPAAVKQPSETIAGACESSSLCQLETELKGKQALERTENMKMSEELGKGKHSVGNSEKDGRTETVEAAEKHEGNVVSPPGRVGVAEEDARKIGTEAIVDEKPVLPLDPSLGELWQDPCIAFAIKTLTGISYEDCTSIKESTGSKSDDIGSLGTFEDGVAKENAGHGSEKQLCSVASPLGNLATPGPAGEAQTCNNGGEKIGSPLGLPSMDAWSDPCIEFAIKTLTGAIPLDYDMVIQDYPQQQVGSSQLEQSNGLSLPSVGDFCQTEYLCQQFGNSDKTLFNQAALAQPAFPPARTINVGFAAGGGGGSRNGARSNQRQR